MAITVTGIVFHAVLAQTLDLKSWAAVGNELVHTVVPVMAVVGWLLIGPRGLFSRRIAGPAAGATVLDHRLGNSRPA